MIKKRRIGSEIWDVNGHTNAIFWIVPTVRNLLSLYNWNLHTNLYTQETTKFGYCRISRTDCHFIYLEMHGVESHLVRARVDRRDIVLSSRLAVGNFIFPFIQTAEAKVVLYMIRPVNADGRKPARSTVTLAVCRFARWYRVSVGSMIARIQLTPHQV